MANLYALQGAIAIMGQANVVDQLVQERAVAVVAGHTRPIIGEQRSVKFWGTIGMPFLPV